MADELKPPVAIRITRPYATEDEFLEKEFDTLTHTSVVLLGAQARPQGVVLRFEIVLKGGDSILRGEGRVVGYKERAHAGEPGLTLRFTRLDSRSKTLVDRASSLRDARIRASTSLMSMPAVVVPRDGAPSANPPPPRSVTPFPSRPSTTPPPSSSAPKTDAERAPPPSRRGPPPLPEWARSDVPPPPAYSAPMDIESTQVDPYFDRAPQPVREPPPPVVSKSVRPTPSRPPQAPRPLHHSVRPAPLDPPPPRQNGSARRDSLERPSDREALLARLRTRAQSLPASRVGEILAKRAR